MSQSIILAQAYIDSVLEIARGNLERAGSVYPMLFLHPFAVSDVEITMVPLKLPEDAKQRARYFAGIGQRLLRMGCIPTEALFLSEGGYVNAQTAPGARRMLPHAHPSRQEAIVVIGGNADNTRTSHVVQPFTRDDMKRPVWQPMPVAVYDEPPSSGSTAIGLLDYFFEAMTA